MGLTQHDQQVLALIDWYRQMGVDEALNAEPVDWLSADARAPGAEILSHLTSMLGETPTLLTHTGRPSTATSTVKSPDREQENPARAFKSPPPDDSLAAATALVENTTTLSDLHKSLLEFEGCGLKATAKNTCFYRGAEQARVMIIGEAPGRDEDLEGRPFVGRAGQLLDRMLKSIDLVEDNVHITNVVYWRPPGNRTPTPQEARVCRPFLEQQVRLVEPEIIILLGGAAAKNLLDTTQGIMRLRGKWHDLELGGASRKVLATLHPAYLLRTPAAKRLAWRDLLALKSALLAPHT